MQKRRRTVNYRSESTLATLAKQEAILRWTRKCTDGFSISEIAALLGVSRQLALYHLKKLAAAGELVMILGPCDSNSGLQYRIWDETQMVVNYTPRHRLQEAA